MKLIAAVTIVALCPLLIGCTQGSKVAIGETYAPVPEKHVQILLAPPSRPSHPIGVVKARGAQLASSEAVYRKLQGEAAELGADAVIVTEEGIQAYATLPGHTDTYASASAYGTANTQGMASAYSDGNTVNAYGNENTVYQGQVQGQSTTVYTPPQTFSGLVVKGLAIKFDK